MRLCVCFAASASWAQALPFKTGPSGIAKLAARDFLALLHGAKPTKKGNCSEPPLPRRVCRRCGEYNPIHFRRKPRFRRNYTSRSTGAVQKPCRGHGFRRQRHGVSCDRRECAKRVLNRYKKRGFPGVWVRLLLCGFSLLGFSQNRCRIGQH